MVTLYSVGQSRRASDAMIPEDMIPGDMIPDNEARRICIAMGNNLCCLRIRFEEKLILSQTRQVL